MALIEQSKDGRKDGGFTRLFNLSSLGSLFSRVHATVIRSGNDLEKFLDDKIEIKYSNIFSNFEKNDFSGLTEMFLNRKMVKNLKWFKAQPDYIYISFLEKQIFVIEMKDGDVFDTKKSAGEIASLEGCVSLIKELPQFKDFNVDFRFCSFNCSEKSMVVKGIKGQITEDRAMVGLGFCNLLGIDYTTLVEDRAVGGEKNVLFFLENLLKIDVIRHQLIKILMNKKEYLKEMCEAAERDNV